MSPRSRRAGFTLAEVMISVGVLTVSAVGVMSMQRMVVRGNVEARQTTTASEITSRWLERLRRDALAWNQEGVDDAALGGTDYLRSIVGQPSTGWLRPAWDGLMGVGFDYHGLPTNDLARAEYCTFVALTWMREGSMMRAEVVTFWPRLGNGAGDGLSDRTAFPECGDAKIDAVMAEIDRPASILHAVRGSVVLLWTPRALGGVAP